MSDAELIARLRELASFERGVGVMQDFYCGDEMVAAADRIEELVKANAMLEGLVGLASIGVDGHGAVVELAKRMTKRALDAEARAERLEGDNK